MTLHIKNMVCNRCITVVDQELTKLGLHVDKIALGEVSLKEENLSESQLHQLDDVLVRNGFERIDDRRARLVESLKNSIIKRIHHSDRVSRKFNWSDVLADEAHLEYNYLSNLFSSMEGITLEQYIIRQKIERAKELLFYDELTLSEIADKLGYSSVAHLSAQFKKVTGLTPSELKKSRTVDAARKPLDSIS
ncbi:helix-turn-helix domain-containing protein [Chryseolinea lacunae]|uniref:Helix-turn-helix transcriptional regulator n=1 Tax=Chryseolinea lacunae TaxID=2801331 RepID=A0ABS1L0M2_9BACT|nr:AraC family transcriptional regulator [Chryseolinea lacunae]MBL0745244.1 helix-turn-helix transcriptional regulator [Chryseolinea lacunae]